MKTQPLSRNMAAFLILPTVSAISVILQSVVGDYETSFPYHIILVNREGDFVIDDLPASFTDQIDVLVKITLAAVLHSIELKSFNDAVPGKFIDSRIGCR